VEKFCRDHAGVEGVGAHGGPAQAFGQLKTEEHVPELRERIRLVGIERSLRLEVVKVEARTRVGNRAHRNYPGARCLHKEWHQQRRQQEGGDMIDTEGHLKAIGRELPLSHVHAGIVHQHMEDGDSSLHLPGTVPDARQRGEVCDQFVDVLRAGRCHDL